MSLLILLLNLSVLLQTLTSARKSFGLAPSFSTNQLIDSGLQRLSASHRELTSTFDRVIELSDRRQITDLHVRRLRHSRRKGHSVANSLLSNLEQPAELLWRLYVLRCKINWSKMQASNPGMCRTYLQPDFVVMPTSTRTQFDSLNYDFSPHDYSNYDFSSLNLDAAKFIDQPPATTDHPPENYNAGSLTVRLGPTTSPCHQRSSASRISVSFTLR